STGLLLGDIVCSVLTIEEGGVLDGTSKMKKTDEKDSNPKIEKKVK
ncbi:MAG: polymer-forming cytoskeletal protein, partial [Syntrophomonadaceae bacterium]|nr:polymer-forming cytoskeletal protein [Syntrophomonadaceae bacterium]